MIPDLTGKVVESVRTGFGLHVRTSDDWTIVIEGKVLVSSADAAPTEIEVAVAESPLPAEVADFAGRTITRPLVAREGRLGLHLADRQISVRADERYEAWHITGPGGELLICMPGGELAHFPPAHNAPAAATDSPSVDPGPTEQAPADDSPTAHVRRGHSPR